MRQQLRDVRFRVDDAHHHRRIARQLPQAGMPDACARPVAFDAAIHNRSRQPQLLTLCHNRLVQRHALPLVALAEVNAQHARLKLLLHPRSPATPSSVCGSSSGARHAYLMMSTSDSTTSPSCTMRSTTGINAFSFVSVSIADSMMDASCERCRGLSLWKWRCDP